MQQLARGCPFVGRLPAHERAKPGVMPSGWQLIGFLKQEFKQLHKFSDRKPGLPDDSPQGAPIYFLVIRN